MVCFTRPRARRLDLSCCRRRVSPACPALTHRQIEWQIGSFHVQIGARFHAKFLVLQLRHIPVDSRKHSVQIAQPRISLLLVVCLRVLGLPHVAGRPWLGTTEHSQRGDPQQ